MTQSLGLVVHPMAGRFWSRRGLIALQLMDRCLNMPDFVRYKWQAWSQGHMPVDVFVSVEQVIQLLFDCIADDIRLLAQVADSQQWARNAKGCCSLRHLWGAQRWTEL